MFNFLGVSQKELEQLINEATDLAKAFAQEKNSVSKFSLPEDWHIVSKEGLQTFRDIIKEKDFVSFWKNFKNFDSGEDSIQNLMKNVLYERIKYFLIQSESNIEEFCDADFEIKGQTLSSNFDKILNNDGRHHNGLGLFITHNGTIYGNLSNLISFLVSEEGKNGLDVFVIYKESEQISLYNFNINKENFFDFFSARKYFSYTPEMMNTGNKLDVVDDRVFKHQKVLQNLQESVKMQFFSDINGMMEEKIMSFDRADFLSKTLPFSGRHTETEHIRNNNDDENDGYKDALKVVRENPDAERLFQEFAKYADLTEREYYDIVNPKTKQDGKFDVGSVLQDRYNLILKVANKIEKLKAKLGHEISDKVVFPIENALQELPQFKGKTPRLIDVKKLALEDPKTWAEVLINNLAYKQNGFVNDIFEIKRAKMALHKVCSMKIKPSTCLTRAKKYLKLVSEIFDNAQKHIESQHSLVVKFLNGDINQKKMEKFDEKIGKW